MPNSLIPGSSRPSLLGLSSDDIGLLAASLKDAMAYFSGNADSANSLLPAIQRSNDMRQRRELLDAATSPDADTRQQAYRSALALGIDPKPWQDAAAQNALPKLLSNMQPQINPVEVTPQIRNPGDLEARKAAGVYSTPIMSTPSISDALRQTGVPELTSEYAPQIIKQQMDSSQKQMRPATAQEKQTYGIDPRTPAMVDAFGSLKPITDPNQITAYQSKELEHQNAVFGETRRHNQASEYAASHPFGDIGTGPDGQAVTGNDFYYQLSKSNPGLANQVKAIATYRQAPPGRGTKQGIALLNLVNQFDPTYDATQFGAKNKARLDFTTGKNGNNVRSLNVAVQHLEQLGRLANALGNGDVQLLNRISQTWSEQTGSPAPTNFDGVKQMVGDEIVKAVVGSGGGVHDRETIANNISRASSPQQLMGVIRQYQGLLGGQLRGLRQQYQKSTGLNDFEDFLDPMTRQKLEAPEAPGGGSHSVQDIVNELRRRGAVK